jgi:NAD(P)-dependent dehydrogenase (short-subunit alcohol dehydrogenase family)
MCCASRKTAVGWLHLVTLGTALLGTQPRSARRESCPLNTSSELLICSNRSKPKTRRRDAELAAAVNEIGRNVTGIQGDVSNLSDLDRLFAQIKREKDRLDILFANAGIAKYAPFGKITEELYDSIFNTNVRGLLFTVQKALPLLADGASMILNASIVASKGLASNSVYSATKAAVRSFARTWTTDLKERRIRVSKAKVVQEPT